MRHDIQYFYLFPIKMYKGNANTICLANKESTIETILFEKQKKAKQAQSAGAR
jgi:hypothetical protein